MVGGNSAVSAAAFTIDAKAIDTAELYLATDSVNHLKVAQNGDISFYEDTGTTAKLFWDASAERLGLGTTSPYASLTVDTANGILNIANANTSGGTKIQAWGATPSDGYLAIEAVSYTHLRAHETDSSRMPSSA